MQAVYRSKKARLGVSGPGRNGRCRLHPEAVALLRILVHGGVLTRRQASLEFLITYRQVNRIMSGSARAGDPGPIEQAKIVRDDNALAYDPTVVIRCGCGAKTHPSKFDRTRCPVCAVGVGTRKSLSA